jgi:hypothetical protein
MDTLLLDRRTAGFTVELHYVEGELRLTGATELHTETVTVAPESARNAFEHPCTYFLSPNSFFRAEPRREEENEEDDSLALADSSGPDIHFT